MESFSPLLCKIQITFSFFLAAAPETQFHQSIHLAAFIWKSVSGHHRLIAMETERESVTQWQVAGGSGTDRQTCATGPLQTKPTGLRSDRRPTSVCSNVIGRDRIVIDLDASVIGPGNAVTHTSPWGSLLTSSLKRLHEFHETCHSKPVFHYTAIKYLCRFLILAR